MAERPAVSRRAAARWPALVALESVMDKVTASAVRMDQGAVREGQRALAAAAGGTAAG